MSTSHLMMQSQNNKSEKWVRVTWMPHTTLSPSSQVCVKLKSVQWFHTPSAYNNNKNNNHNRELSVRVSIGGVGNLPLSMTAQSQYSSLSPQSMECHFQHQRMLQFSIRWRDLPRDAYWHFQLVELEQVISTATIPCFTQHGRLLTGLQRLKLQTNLSQQQNYGNIPLKPRDDSAGHETDRVWKATALLHQLQHQQARATTMPVSAFGETPSVPWLDAMLNQRALDIIQEHDEMKKNEYSAWTPDDEDPVLIVEFPTFDIPIMHEETFYPTHDGAVGLVTPLDLAVYRKQQADPNHPLALVQFLDYETEDDNPVEDKYRTLAHDLLRGLVDPALKPDRQQQTKLAAIMDSTSHHLSREEKDLLWRFRFSLVDNRRALNKFLLAVDWTVDSEVVQAAELLEQWRKRSPIEVTDALKLLGKHVAFQTNLVRQYAIDTLEAAPDSELRLYLLQLVQALKYENMEMVDATGTPAVGQRATSPLLVSSLANFLITRAAGNMGLANFLYWYIKVELSNPTHGARYRNVFHALERKLCNTPFVEPEGRDTEQSATSKSFKSIVGSVSSKIGTSFRSESGGGERERSSSKKVKSRSMWDILLAQDEFISGVLDIQQRCRDTRGKKDAKEEQLRSMLAKEGFDKVATRDPIPLPSAPDIYVNGLHPETAKMFKSALYPAVVDFHVEALAKTGSLEDSVESHPSSHKVIVKTGDDLRQDQLIIMMIQLMDGLLKRAALDLCLTPYSILATSTSSGLVEFVEGSIPISQILSQYNNSIMAFFQSTAGKKNAKYDVKPDVLSTYVRSCAGYCVITYLLGVGDRHLDNILLRASGHLFHIDFGFIFGRDPKPLPPAFRLTREMVDGMGGVDSSEYRQFCSLACQAFNALRKSAGLVLNLLHLMSDAGIEDLSNNPSADAEGVIAKVEERFRLDLTDEQAERFFVGLINDCLAALAPRVMDVFHSFSVARR